MIRRLAAARPSAATWTVLAIGLVIGLAFAFVQARTLFAARHDRAGVAAAVGATSVVHELQVERGLSSLYLAGGDPEVRARLDRQRSRVDHAVRDYRAGVRATDLRDGQLANDVARTLRAHDGIPALRARVDARAIDSTESVGRYNRLVGTTLDVVRHARGMADPEVTRELTTLAHLAVAKEGAGRQRALLAAALRAGAFGDDAYDQFAAAHAAQVGAMEAFRQTASRREQEAYAAKVPPHATRATSAAIDAALAAGPGAPLHADPEQWFAAQTDRIERMRAVEVAVAADARDRADDRFLLALAGLLLALLIGGAVALGAAYASWLVGARVPTVARRAASTSVLRVWLAVAGALSVRASGRAPRRRAARPGASAPPAPRPAPL